MDAASIHATAVAEGDAALLLCGPSGAGKSETAAGMVALGGRLVADDLCVLRRASDGISVHRPAGRPPMLELRGLGLVAVRSADAVPLRGILFLGPSAERLPPCETVRVLGADVPALRHPNAHGLPAKAMLWLSCHNHEQTGAARDHIYGWLTSDPFS